MPIDPRWEPPTLRERKKSYWWVWILILVVLIGIAFYYVNQPAVPVVSQQQEIVPAETTAPAQETKPVFKSEAPTFDSHCTVVAGVVSGSIKTFDNKVTFTFKNNGKEKIEGSYFEASNENVKAYRQNSESLNPGEEVTYSIDLNDVSKEVGVSVQSFVVLPIQDSKACMNQRMIVMK